MRFTYPNLKKFKQDGKDNVLHKLVADPRLTGNDDKIKEVIDLIHSRCDHDNEMIRMRNESQETPLHTAAQYDCETAAKIFIDK